MVVLLVFLSLAVGQGVGFFYKLGSSRGTDEKTSPALLCSMYMLLTCLIYTGIALFQPGGYHASPITFCVGIPVGICFSVAAYFYLIAFNHGPFTPTVIIMSLSSFMPILYSWIFLNESATWMQVIGLVLTLFVVLALTTMRKSAAEEKRFSVKWLVYMIIVFFTNSFITFGVRVHSHSLDGAEFSALYSIVFATGCLTSIVLFLCAGGPKKRPAVKPLLLPAAGLACCIGINMVPMLLLSKYLPAVVQYPLIGGASILLSTAVGRIVFKERLAPRAYAAIGVGIVAIIMLSI